MRIDGLFPFQNVSTADIKDILSRLNVGDSVRAQVIDITSNELLLKLFDGTTINASSMTSIDAKKGDFVDFIVKNKSDKQLFLETVKENNKSVFAVSDGESKLKQQLAVLDIKAEGANLEVAKEMTSGKIPLSKEFIGKAVELLARYKELDPPKAVFLTSNNIGIQEKNIGDLRNMLDGKLKIGEKLNDLTALVDSIDDAKVLEGIAKQLQTAPTAISSAKNAAYDNAVSKVMISEVPVNEAGKVEVKEAELNKTHYIKTIVNDEAVKLENAPIKNIIQNSGLVEKAVNLFNEIKSSGGIFPKEKLEQFLNEEIPKFSIMPEEDKKLINDLFGKLLDKFKAIRENEDVLDIGRGVIAESTREKEHAKSIIKKAFDEIFVKVDSKTLSEDINPKEVYKSIINHLDALREKVSESTIPNRNEILDKVDNLQNNLKFLNEINSHNTYIQIPLNILNKNTTGELYVLKRDGKRKRIDPENVTMLVSLDTENMGQVDTLISLNKKNISLNMRVEDKDAFDIIKEAYKDLYKSLAEKGYKLVDLKYRLIEERVNVVNVEDVAKKELESGRGKIDYRL